MNSVCTQTLVHRLVSSRLVNVNEFSNMLKTGQNIKREGLNCVLRFFFFNFGNSSSNSKQSDNNFDLTDDMSKIFSKDWFTTISLLV